MKYLIRFIIAAVLIAVLYLWGPAVVSYGFYVYGLKYISVDTVKAEQAIARARDLFAADLYDRALVEIALFKLNKLQSGAVPASELQAKVLALSNEAVGWVEEAIKLRPTDYRNWWAGAHLYQQLALLGVVDAAQRAAGLYTTACRLMPPNEPGAKALTEVCYAKLTPAP
jgi:hypothetical protein